MKTMVLVAVGGMVATMGTVASAEAKTTRTTRYAAYGHGSHKSAGFDPNDPKCIEAEALDPGGAYKAYPCWARAALAPKGGGPSWQ
jgi:hypothetical protein